MLWKAVSILRSFGQNTSRATVEDIAQEVFQKVYLLLPTFDRARSSLSSFITLVTKTTTIDHARKLQSQDRYLIPLDGANRMVERLKAGSLDARVLADAVYKAAASIPSERDRKMVSEFLSGRTINEISAKYSIVPSTAYRRSSSLPRNVWQPGRGRPRYRLNTFREKLSCATYCSYAVCSTLPV